MGHQRWGILAGALATVVAVAAPASAAQAVDATAGESELAAIVIRTYTQPDLEGAMGIARRTANAILDRAGVRIGWLECGLAGDSGETSVGCREPLRPNELVVRILSAGPARYLPDAETLGFAFVDTGTGAGSLATVYADRVRMLAQAACVRVDELLGKTIAHEIGHLLLGTNRHTGQGLMRASWSGAELRRDRDPLWSFGNEEAELIRRGVANRHHVVSTF
jgi:hypothetical protein